MDSFEVKTLAEIKKAKVESQAKALAAANDDSEEEAGEIVESNDTAVAQHSEHSEGEISPSPAVLSPSRVQQRSASRASHERNRRRPLSEERDTHTTVSTSINKSRPTGLSPNVASGSGGRHGGRSPNMGFGGNRRREEAPRSRSREQERDREKDRGTHRSKDRDVRDSRDIRYTKDTKDNRDIRDRREDRESRDGRESRDVRNARDAKGGGYREREKTQVRGGGRIGDRLSDRISAGGEKISDPHRRRDGAEGGGGRHSAGRDSSGRSTDSGRNASTSKSSIRGSQPRVGEQHQLYERLERPTERSLQDAEREQRKDRGLIDRERSKSREKDRTRPRQADDHSTKPDAQTSANKRRKIENGHVSTDTNVVVVSPTPTNSATGSPNTMAKDAKTTGEEIVSAGERIASAGSKWEDDSGDEQTREQDNNNNNTTNDITTTTTSTTIGATEGSETVNPETTETRPKWSDSGDEDNAPNPETHLAEIRMSGAPVSLVEESSRSKWEDETDTAGRIRSPGDAIDYNGNMRNQELAFRSGQTRRCQASNHRLAQRHRKLRPVLYAWVA